jgi:DNA replication protein DnaC
MKKRNNPPKPPLLIGQLDYLKLSFIKAQHGALAEEAAQKHWDHVEYLRRLIDGEFDQRRQLTIQRRIKAARFPVLKTLAQFRWDWPKKLNRLQVQNLFRLEFIPQKANAVFLGTVGIGKTHLATALGYAACLEGYSVLFADAITVINDLSAAQQAGTLKRELKKYLRPQLLVLDEVGYLPIDQRGADLLFQVISQRYERGSIVLTTNKPFKQWPSIFNNDSTIASAVLDRLLHHAETVLMHGSSYRMKDRIDN